ncbi:class I SAM-dependent methyltransferase [Desulfotalea psychrophila]|nr:class I SAM-dependent methyltransferase [Desulfotalea psychrophila]
MKKTTGSPIIYKDAQLLVVDKPTGFSSQAMTEGEVGITEWLALHLQYQIDLYSSLTKSCSGVLLLRRKNQIEKAENDQPVKIAEKKYHFISAKRYRGQTEEDGSWLVERDNSITEESVRFRFLEEGRDYSLYEAATLSCCRRVQEFAEESGIAIVGDGADSPFARLFLHCHSIRLAESGHEFISSTPDSFSFVLKQRDKVLIDTAIAWERRLGWLQLITNSYRLIQRGELDLPVSIDLYDNTLSITGFSEEKTSTQLRTLLEPALDYLRDKLAWQGALLRRHAQNPHQKKLIHDVIQWGAPISSSNIAHEHLLDFEVNINESQHVGLFLDQRDSRRRVWQIAEGRRVANLFSFTCSFSAAALAGGAEVVFSVDLAGSTLARGKGNFALNHLDESGRGKFIKEDVCKWLQRQERKYARNPEEFTPWDLIICDPPVFASAGKGQAFHVEKQWPELARQIRMLLSVRGVALFANNHRGGNASYYRAELEKHFSLVRQMSPPMDFPRLAGSPEHVRIYWCQV